MTSVQPLFNRPSRSAFLSASSVYLSVVPEELGKRRSQESFLYNIVARWRTLKEFVSDPDKKAPAQNAASTDSCAGGDSLQIGRKYNYQWPTSSLVHSTQFLWVETQRGI